LFIKTYLGPRAGLAWPLSYLHNYVLDGQQRDERMYTAVELHPTRHIQTILQVVDCIYAAACGETPWEQTLAEVCQVGRLGGCALSMVDRRERRRIVAASYGLSFAAEPRAMLGPMPGNPQLTDSVLQSTPGTIWQDRPIMLGPLSTTSSFRTGRMQPNGLVSWACVVVGRDDRQVVCLEVHAGPGRAAGCPGLDDFLRQLAPHLTRAWRLGRTTGSILPTSLCAASQSDAAPAPDRPGLPGVTRLRAEFGLTKAEARLALRLAEGTSLASAAQAFNVKLTTIRSQLQQVFAKTGTSRQTELVAMLLSRGHASRGLLWSGEERQSAALAEPGS
jgi:DNA-binding CsgD family transcriptional regulator